MLVSTHAAEIGSPEASTLEGDSRSDPIPYPPKEMRRANRRARWLETNILPHEKAVRQMLRRDYPKADPDEVLQSTYLRLMATSEVDHVKNVKWYFFMTARSVVRDRARREGMADLEPLDLDQAEWPADEPPIEQVIDGRRALQRFHEAVRALPERQREVFELRRVEGLCVRATADRLATSVSSVEKHQKHAMRRLAEVMAPF